MPIVFLPSPFIPPRLHKFLPYEPNPFVIDVAILKQRFRNAQAQCHPDSWASKGSNKQDIAQALSARINEAYQSLLNPLSRVEYILQQHHVPVSETDQVDDAGFMAEIMEARETIEEAEDGSDVENLLKQNTGEFILYNAFDDVDQFFHTGEIERTLEEIEARVGQEQWSDVKKAAVRLRYLQGVARAGKKWFDSR
ncbi:hypothetical protein H0H81_010757 [Sphagnurus paluster]|uniref:Co-chaperone HscB C-terminal oligomerisation domain-containing protein n=1 Tax=Sphagnurus paluster TaxID=117069 RepID=A0A9P7FUY4_9AGAR|nr:hypothetical protein H0H81_010757 [Sphagnurus paluster]